MRQIFKSIYGSHLYGTNVETSDTDYKGVGVPTADEILLCEIPKTETTDTNTDSKRKNTKDDVDCQMFSLKKYLHDLMNGQTYAYELLFSPKQFWDAETSPIWLELIANKDKMICSNVTAMVGYARAQAFKYGEKGKRLDVFRDVIECFETMDPRWKIEEVVSLGSLEKTIKKHNEFISYHKKDNDNSGVEYLDVNGVMVPLGCSIEYALEVYKPRLEEYGARAKQASKDNGNDLKAIYHAVRIARQAEELLKFGTITLPRPESAILLEIRKGNIPEAEMKHIIDESFEAVRAAEKTSQLQRNPDKEWMKQFLKDVHYNIVKEEKQNGK